MNLTSEQFKTMENHRKLTADLIFFDVMRRSKIPKETIKINHLIDLKIKGLSWREIEARDGVNTNSAKSAMSQYKTKLKEQQYDTILRPMNEIKTMNLFNSIIQEDTLMLVFIQEAEDICLKKMLGILSSIVDDRLKIITSHPGLNGYEFLKEGQNYTNHLFSIGKEYSWDLKRVQCFSNVSALNNCLERTFNPYSIYVTNEKSIYKQLGGFLPENF